MSGHPYRYSTDKEMYRAEYMKNLQERIDLDDMVLQAVKGYVSNGTLPAVSQLQDTRTTAEKLMDVQKLKQELITDLKPIMDQTTASNFIQALIQSPLNIDNKLVIFLAQNANELVKEVAKKYKYGIKGDSNDIYTFVEFINNSYALINNTKASVKSVMDSGYSKPGQGIINRYELQTFETDLMKTFGQATISQLPNFNRGEVIVLLEAIRAKIAGLVRDLPDDDQIQEMERHLVTGQYVLDESLNRRITELFGWMKEKLPNKQYIISLSNSVSGEMMNGLRTGITDIQMILKSLKAIYDLLPDTGDLPDIQAIMDDLNDQAGDGGDGGDGSLSGSSGSSGYSGSSGPSYNLPTAPDGESDRKMNDLQRRLDALEPEGQVLDDPAIVDLQERLDALNAPSSLITPPQRSSILDALQARFDALSIPSVRSAPSSGYMVPSYLQNLPQVGYSNPLFQPDMGQAKPAEKFEKPSKTYIEKPGQPSDQFSSSKMGSTKPSRGPPQEDIPIPTRRGEIKDLGRETDDKIQRLLEERRDMFNHYHKKFKEPDIKSPQMLERSQNLAIGRNNDALEKQGFDMSILDKIDKATLRGLQGQGIGKRRGRPKGTGFKQNIENHIDTQKGIQPDFRFSKFGKYLIRNDHLMDNKVSIRTGKGLNITGMPSTKTNSKVINIIKKIIGGALPSFDEMNKLNEEEKKYLHDISKKSNILEKLNIPTPSKDKEEKDLHEFEVMKGEIMAGNDNKDMIRKFKGLILKFSKAGTLPKQQVNEILGDLLDLGY